MIEDYQVNLRAKDVKIAGLEDEKAAISADFS